MTLIIKGLLKIKQNKFIPRIYAFYTVVLAALWETYAFQHQTSGSTLNIIGIAFVFLFMHLLVIWMVRAVKHGWSRPIKKSDLSTAFKLLIPTTLFALPYFFLNHNLATGFAVITHMLYNGVVLYLRSFDVNSRAARLGRWLALGSVVDPNEEGSAGPLSNPNEILIEWLSKTAVALLSQNVNGVLGEIKPIDLDRFGKPIFDDHLSIITGLNELSENTEFKDLLSENLESRMEVFNNLTEEEKSTFIDLLISVVLMKAGKSDHLNGILNQSTIGEKNLLILSGKTAGSDRQKRNIGIMSTLLKWGPEAVNTFVVDDDARTEIQLIQEVMKKCGMTTVQFNIEIKKELINKLKNKTVSIEDVYKQYNNPNNIILPENLKPTLVPSHIKVLTFEELLTPLEFLNISQIAQRLKVILVAA
ncbi:MAG: hypothetical protein ACKVQC_09040 [Elusimicrobiota bacterium]